MNLLLLLSAIVAFGSDANPITIEKLEACARQAVESRNRIKDYHLTITLKVDERANEQLTSYHFEFEAWRKGDRYRLDRKLISESTDPKNNGTRYIYCRNCERVGMGLKTSMGPASNTPVNFFNLDIDDPRHYHIDWRYLGLRKSEIYNKGTRPDVDMLELRKCSNPLLAEITKGASTLKQFHCDTPAGVAKVTFDGTASNNPIYFYLDARRGKDILDSSTSVTYQEIDGIFYPKSYSYSSKMNGKIVMHQFELFVTLVEFNPVIEDKIFTLAGLNLDEGQPVRLPEIQDSSQQPTWRNGKLDRDYTWSKSATEGFKKLADKKAANPVPDVAPGIFDGRWPYFLVAAFFAIAGILIGRKIRRG